jgi:hypothetical protein
VAQGGTVAMVETMAADSLVAMVAQGAALGVKKGSESKVGTAVLQGATAAVHSIK